MIRSTERTPPGWRAAAVCAVAGLVVFGFFGNATRGYVDTPSLFWWWVSQWLDPQAEAQHGWLVLALSGWLFWRGLGSDESADNESAAPEPRAKNGPVAAAALLAGLALHAIGFVAQQTRISIVGALLFAWGVLRLAGGRRWGDAAKFPLAFLVFAIPFNALDSVGFWLRVWVVNASAAIAHAVGIGVLQSGTQLIAPDGRYHYDVAAACSGVRSLTALAALSLLVGYLQFRATWRRALIFLLCFPLVYLGNVARIVAIVLAAQMGGPKWGDVAHEVMGFGVFAIVLGGILAACAALRRRWPEGRDASPRRPTKRDTASTQAADASQSRPYLIAALVVGLAVGEMVLLHHLTTAPPRGKVGVLLAADGLNPVELPTFLGTEWIGGRAEVSAVEREILPADTGFSRKTYVALGPPRREVFLSIVLSGRDRTSIHRPELCLVGQGWTVESAAPHRFAFPGRADAAFPATLLRVGREIPTPRGKVRRPGLVAYWFVSGDRVVATHWARFACDAWNRVAHARADRWAYVVLQTDASDGEAAALARMQTVLDATLPRFQRPLPVR